MRTFSCFIYTDQSPTPVLAFVFAADESRARELARRELMDERGAVWVEICEDGRPLAVEFAPAHVAQRPALERRTGSKQRPPLVAAAQSVSAGWLLWRMADQASRASSV